MKVKIRRANKDIPFPEYGTKDSAAFDIASNEDINIKPQQIVLIKTGLFIQCPEGHFLAIFSRSSTPIKKGLSQPHGVGVLDPDYSGPTDEMLIMCQNFTDKDVEIKKGDRIAQGIFMKFDHVQWDETDELSNTSRSGFGSTGK